MVSKPYIYYFDSIQLAIQHATPSMIEQASTMLMRSRTIGIGVYPWRSSMVYDGI